MRGFLVLLSVLLVLEKTQGNETYEQLNPHKRGIVDKAIKRANGEFGNQHLDYSSILKPTDVQHILHVLLKSTSCEKITPAVHKGECEIQEKAKPQVSCVDCNGEMLCVLLKDYEKATKYINDCPRVSIYHTSGGTLLSQKGEDGQKTGCLGCV